MSDIRWVDYIVQALEELEGVGSLSQIYQQILLKRQGSFSESWTATVRRTLEDNSSDSKNFIREDLFYSVDGIGKGIWGLRNYAIPISEDIEEVEPEDNSSEPSLRKIQTLSRIIRITSLASAVKGFYKSKCQICSFAFQLPNGKNYAEAHHLRPLGGVHKGPDKISNIICVCPNHHAMLDFGAIKLTKEMLTSHADHKVDDIFIEYHNTYICSSLRGGLINKFP